MLNTEWSKAIKLSHGQKVVYWLIDYTAPSFVSRFGRDDLEGKLLIASRQLWSLVSGEKVRSALIGPGYVEGTIQKATGEIKVEEPISGIVFDPTELRPTEPLPLVNIISPEVIDPVAKSSEEEIEDYLCRTVVSRGKPLVSEKLTEVKSLTSIPLVQYSSTSKTKLEIRYTSGVAKARFALGGVHRKIYAPYVSNLQRKRYDDVNALKVFWVDRREMINPTREGLSEWMITEQNAESAELEETPKDGYTQITGEYTRALDFIKANSSSYILL
nr:hypothetical protein [Candidatus Njordarchaeum guaymaensis]